MTGLTTRRVEYSRPEASFDLALLPESTTEEPCRGQHDSSRLPSKRPLPSLPGIEAGGHWFHTLTFARQQ